MPIEQVTRYTVEPLDPVVSKGDKKSERDGRPATLSEQRNVDLAVRVDRFPELIDFYSTFDELEVTADDRQRFKRIVAHLGDRDGELAQSKLSFTVVRFRNDEGIPSPLPLTLTFTDDTTQSVTLPAEIWRYAGGARASKLIVTDKEIMRVELDRHRQIADRDSSDNIFPQEIAKSTFAVEPRERGGGGSNPMRAAMDATTRESTRALAATLAKRVAEAVKAGRSAGSVLTDQAATDLKDGWGVSFIVLDGAEQGSGGIAQIISAGPDRAVGGDDDITFIVTAEGEAQERAVSATRRGRGRGGARRG